MSFIGFKFSKFDKLYFISILSLSFLIFSFFVNSNVFSNFYDEKGYLYFGKDILFEGTFDSPIRTYLYPSIIAFFYFLLNGDLVNIKILISIFQYLVYIITIIFIANCINVKNNKNKLIWYSIITVGFLNPYLIQASTLLLTDILASCFIINSILIFLFKNLNKTKIISLASGLFFAAIMIRPSVLIFLPIIIIIFFFRFFNSKNFYIKKNILIFFVFALILLPQLSSNVSHFDDWTPLLHGTLYDFQITLGVKLIKYGTVVIEGEDPRLNYYNPFYTSSEETDMFHLLYTDLVAFIPTYFSHMFGVLDWGHVDTYISDYYPSNRIPASLFLYSVWFFVLFGTLKFISNKPKTKNAVPSWILIFSAFLYLLFIATTAVESRFGYPVFLLLLPFFGIGIKKFVQMKIWPGKVILGINYFLFISVLLYISFLFDLQTGRIDWFEFLS